MHTDWGYYLLRSHPDRNTEAAGEIAEDIAGDLAEVDTGAEADTGVEVVDTVDTVVEVDTVVVDIVEVDIAVVLRTDFVVAETLPRSIS